MGGWAKFLTGAESAAADRGGRRVRLRRVARPRATRRAHSGAGRRDDRPGRRGAAASALERSGKPEQERRRRATAVQRRAARDHQGQHRSGSRSKPPTTPVAGSAENALQAASSFSIELGARTQELLERLTDQAASIAKIEAALPADKTASAAICKARVSRHRLARVNGSAPDSSSANSPVELSQTKLSDAALMARVIEGINNAPPTAPPSRASSPPTPAPHPFNDRAS